MESQDFGWKPGRYGITGSVSAAFFGGMFCLLDGIVPMIFLFVICFVGVLCSGLLVCLDYKKWRDNKRKEENSI